MATANFADVRLIAGVRNISEYAYGGAGRLQSYLSPWILAYRFMLHHKFRPAHWRIEDFQTKAFGRAPLPAPAGAGDHFERSLLAGEDH